ncbi:hypothetical protein [Sphingobacterium mizutaii]|uniref:hypothetical protein n=1 Tax=Sphingobacterium mizutaii TaxID=1010 RepID=UPI001623F3B3|nr:hypothetical protein [Sphingobacterium mizutaii]
MDLNQDGKDERMGQDVDLNQDGVRRRSPNEDWRIGQDLDLNLDGDQLLNT